MNEQKISANGDLQKPAWYYDTHDHDIINLLSTGPESAILELGCGTGATGQKALATRKAGRYVGIEIDQTAADIARGFLSDVNVGNVETIDLSHLHGSFDVLIASEVLEHLVNPWNALRRLRMCLKPGGMVFASSPNIAHWQIIRALLKGQFRYVEYGVMDATHLRWFTPESYRDLFTDSGFVVQALFPVRKMGWKAELADRITGGRLTHIFMKQIVVVAQLPPAAS